jgi:hypothetical protein
MFVLGELIKITTSDSILFTCVKIIWVQTFVLSVVEVSNLSSNVRYCITYTFSAMWNNKMQQLN